MTNEEKARKMTKFLSNGGMELIFILSIFAIVLKLMSFYCIHRFEWIDLIWEVPLYGFCGWALWKAWKMFCNCIK